MVLVLEPSGRWEKKYKRYKAGRKGKLCMLEMGYTCFNSKRSTIMCLVPKSTNANKRVDLLRSFGGGKCGVLPSSWLTTFE
jgi:hypothetical protein